LVQPNLSEHFPGTAKTNHKTSFSNSPSANQISTSELLKQQQQQQQQVMHGQYVRSIDRQLIGEEDTLLYLKVKYWQHKTRHCNQNIV
jgi:hypothetical protein